MKKKTGILEESPRAKSEQPKAGLPQVKRDFTKRMLMLAISGLLLFSGSALFVLYFFNESLIVGAPAIFLVAGGGFLFKHYWGDSGDAVTEYIGKPVKEQVNSLCLYRDKIVFMDVYEPGGYPWTCLNDKKKYYVNKWNETENKLAPFVLPDQQYYDPVVFAERVLELPAHRKIFTRKPTIFQKLKTGLLVVAIIIVWLLIVTTTGGG